MLASKPNDIVYPDSDGKPMADNTLQFQWIVTLKENLDARRPDFVAGNLLWYPVEGQPKIRQAPDVLVAIGRPKGYRGSYLQWREGGVAPQVVFEILSPGNRRKEKQRKFSFYQTYGIEELYVYDPDHETLQGWLRDSNGLQEVERMNGFISPRLGIRFQHGETLHVFHANGEPFQTVSEIVARADEEKARADNEKARADEEKTRADREQARAEALAHRLRELGIELPD